MALIIVLYTRLSTAVARGYARVGLGALEKNVQRIKITLLVVIASRAKRFDFVTATDYIRRWGDILWRIKIRIIYSRASQIRKEFIMRWVGC